MSPEEASLKGEPRREGMMAKKDAEGGQVKFLHDEEERGLHIESDSMGSFESYCAHTEQNVVEKSPQGRYVCVFAIQYTFG